MIDPAEISQLLLRHSPFDSDEALSLERTIDLVARFASPCDQRLFQPGHITASAIALGRAGHVGLIYHSKLERWLQPGGHVEPSDDALVNAAARELVEETSLRADIALGQLLDVDAHIIPTWKDDPEHVHFDLRFLFPRLEGTPVAASDAKRFRWIEPAAILSAPDVDHGLKRAIEKVLRHGPLT